MAKHRKKRKKRQGEVPNRPSITGRQVPGGRISISLCMIVKNEARFLEDCLKSVRELVDEVVIVDTGSTDSTLKIAAKFDARVIPYVWDEDFAKARNAGLKQAKNPWILYLDADERLHPPHHDLVRKAVTSGNADAYYINVKSEVRGVLGNVPHIQAYPRLFRKIPGVKFIGRVHEQITPSLQAHQARFAVLPAEIEHLGYAQSDEILREKINRNLKYLRKQVKEEPGNPYALFQLGQTCILAEKKEEGKKYLRKTIEGRNLTNSLAATALLILANEAYKDAAYDEALGLIDRAVQIAPRQRLGWFLKSECLGKIKKWPEAITALKELLQNNKRQFTDLSLDKIFEPFLISQRMGIYHYHLENFRKAVKYFESYMISAPKPLRVAILKQYIEARQQCPPAQKISEQGDILKVVSRLPDFDRLEDAVRLLGGFAENSNDFRLQKVVFETAHKISPNEAMYIYYLGNACLNLEQYAEAESCYEKAEKLSPSIYEIHFNRGVAAIKQEHYHDAIDSFRKIRDQFPEHAVLATNKLAGLYAKIGEPEKAIQVLTGLTI